MPNQINATLNKELPAGLEDLLTEYQVQCRKNGLRESSIELYLKECRWFLQNLSENGCRFSGQINARHVAAACLALKSNSYLSTIKTFLRFLFSENYTDRDYSNVVPDYKRPQPIPTVYAEEEIKRFESAIRAKGNKRDYAAVLLATRLGMRSGDISGLSFNDVDFDRNAIHITQQKTNEKVELPMLPEIKTALCDYIKNERPSAPGPYIFLAQNPPHDRLTVVRIGKIVRQGLKVAGIDTESRSRGLHAFRSSLASSMVNDGVPYEVVRKTLGHTDPNAIKSYARLDIERLRSYALEAPKATGGFYGFLHGREVS